ncbi:MAG: response regulator [Afipia sp.]|jgi:CheY-like chemotaxis protein|nr:response regulator [Afipia sp.]
MTTTDAAGPAAQNPADLPSDVLIVEDDTLIALDASETISGFGVASVRAARGVADALELIAARAPDFVLLDVGLIREKSFAVAEQLVLQKIPFVFVTGYSGPAALPAALARYPVLRKPYLRDELLDTLRRWRDSA